MRLGPVRPGCGSIAAGAALARFPECRVQGDNFSSGLPAVFPETCNVMYNDGAGPYGDIL
jgi:hypothetical protein